jgi:hypothetical protein
MRLIPRAAIVRRVSGPPNATLKPLKLETLAPEFSEVHHGTYLSALERAIDHQPTARNIALAGAYGVGKSSVLGEFAKRRRKRVIKASLLTLGLEPEASDEGLEANPAARTTSNRIQKEIVKQLLYQQSPARSPQSRFRRIVRPRLRVELPIAVGGSIALLLVLFTSGLLVPPATTLDIDIWSPSSPARLATFSGVALVVAALLIRLVRSIAAGHVGIDKVAAGPATISLPPRSTSYFDEYLDEIIYFFEVNGRRDIVIIEDLDRFGDPGIYESPHSLNGLLNAAKQLRRRNIRFVYAVRDSIFEGHGLTRKGAPAGAPTRETDRGNRTKFFELIIPMVPFITHKNARDLLHQALTRRGHVISQQLIDLAARHLPDMRLIHNIVNEYDVFKRQLLDVASPVPELDPERLFSMVLFKNTQAGDFEAIRHGDSSLDGLFAVWRDLVGENVDRLRTENDRLRRRVDEHAAAADHAVDLGRRLRRAVAVLADAPGTILAGKSISVDGSRVDATTLGTAEFWRDFRQNGSTLTLLMQPDQYHNSRKMTLDADAVETLIGTSLDSAAWTSRSVEEDLEEMRLNDATLAFLRRHSWEALLAREDLTLVRDDLPPMTFRAWAEHLLPSRLAMDLVAQGYITSYFPLHISAFYGQLIRPDAMTYIMRNVDTGTADPEYPLAPADVEAIVADQGRGVLTERSMRNVHVVDHLLSSDADAAETVIRALPGDGEEGLSFIRRYLSTGQHADGFVAALTRHWPSVFDYLVDDAPLSAEGRARLFSVAMDNRGKSRFVLTDGVRSFLTRRAGDIGSLSEPISAEAAEQAVRFVVDSGAVLPDATALSDLVRRAIRGTRSYELNAANIEALSGSTSLALDVLRDVDDEMYAYAIDDPEGYFRARDEAADPGATIEEPTAFVEILQAAADWPTETIARLVADASAGCRAESLSEVPTTAWSALVSDMRTDASFDNVTSYLDEFGSLDPALAMLLRDAEEITGAEDASEEERVKVGLHLVNADSRVLTDARRVALAASTEIALPSVGSVVPRSGDLVGLLIQAGLIEDGEDAFSSRLMVDWRTQESAIVKSARFVEFVGPETLATTYIGPLMRSEQISDAVRAALVGRLDEYGPLPPDAFEGIASAALRNRVGLTGAQVATVVQGGIPEQRALDLLALAVTRGALAPDDLRRLLRFLGGDLAVVADTGRRRPKLRDSPATRRVLRELEEAGIVSQVKEEGPGELRVTLHRG